MSPAVDLYLHCRWCPPSRRRTHTWRWRSTRGGLCAAPQRPRAPAAGRRSTPPPPPPPPPLRHTPATLSVAQRTRLLPHLRLCVVPPPPSVWLNAHAFSHTSASAWYPRHPQCGSTHTPSPTPPPLRRTPATLSVAQRTHALASRVRASRAPCKPVSVSHCISECVSFGVAQRKPPKPQPRSLELSLSVAVAGSFAGSAQIHRQHPRLLTAPTHPYTALAGDKATATTVAEDTHRGGGGVGERTHRTVHAAAGP
jgi:hypothetical protein